MKHVAVLSLLIQQVLTGDDNSATHGVNRGPCPSGVAAQAAACGPWAVNRPCRLLPLTRPQPCPLRSKEQRAVQSECGALMRAQGTSTEGKEKMKPVISC